MLFSVNRLFTIGQFAKMHEINKKTLMWYDEIGLLKPAVVKENGYRYYNYQQSYILEEKLDQAVTGARKYHLHRLYDASCGAMLPVENIYKGKSERYTALYLELPKQMREQALHIQPAGEYLRAFCKGGPAASQAVSSANLRSDAKTDPAA